MLLGYRAAGQSAKRQLQRTVPFAIRGSSTLPFVTAEASAPLLLRGGGVFDSASRTFRAGLDVLVVDGRISVLGPALGAAGAKIIDCAGAFVLPGLIDCHVHITSSGDPGELNAGATRPVAENAWKSAKFAKQTLEAGFTTVRDLGATGQLNVHLARAIDAGLVAGPRIVAAGMGVTMTGGHGHGFIAVEADGPDEVRKRVREQLRAGATAIKLFASGGVMAAGVDPRSPSFTEDELRAGVEEAHKAFRPVAAHAQATDGIKNAIRAGIDSIEHGVWLDDEAIELMLEHGTYLVATLTAPWQIFHSGLAAGIPPYMVEKAEQVLDDHRLSFDRAMKAGVKLAMGTDQGTPVNRPGENAQEILRIVERGLSPAAALMASTAWAAELLRVDHETGRINEKLAADMLVVQNDPLADISSLMDQSNILAVVKGGQVVRSTRPPTSEV